jgi:UDP-glucuronate 4-epimerase
MSLSDRAEQDVLHGGSVSKSSQRNTQETPNMNILITGVAGFIGSALALRLLERGDSVYGIDNMNNYYDVHLKEARLKRTIDHHKFRFEKLDIINRKGMAELFHKEKFDAVMHLAAQAGVRYSITNPEAYVDANLVGFGNILEGCRQSGVKHLVFASSSSVYGANTKLPFSEHDNVDHPVSLYAATKKANELMAHTYSHLYGLPTTGLRFFTVYGPWGRPDMALFKFTRAILRGEPIEVYNHGRMQRDFTYIDDIAEGVIRVADRVPAGDPDWTGERPDPGTSRSPYRIYNIGNHQPVELMDLIAELERCLGREAEKLLLPMQPGDVPATFADVEDLVRDTGFRPATPIQDGVREFVRWYREYYKV